MFLQSPHQTSITHNKNSKLNLVRFKASTFNIEIIFLSVAF